MLLQLDPGDDEAELSARMGVEAAAQNDIARVLARMEKRLVASVRRFESAPDWMREDFEAEVTALRKEQALYDVLHRALLQSASLGVEVAIDQLDNVGIAFDWTLAHEQARQFAIDYTYELVRGINDTTERQVRQAVTDWVSNGLPLPDLVAELAPIFGPVRAQIIAATEVTRAYAEGSRRAYRQSGVVAGLVWRTANDELVCPKCGPLNGTRAPLDGDFGGYFPPAHPRCRCWIAGELMEAGG